MTLSRVTLLAACLLRATSALAQGGFSEADLRPFLQIHSSILSHEGLTAPIEVLQDELLSVSQGGATVRTKVFRIGDVVKSEIMHGLATAQELGTLKRGIAASRAGVQVDCEIRTDRFTAGFIEVTWFGKGIRRSQFRILFAAEPSSLPACPVEVESLFNIFSAYGDGVLDNPGTQVFVSP